ncbi:hypothetical protein BC835DRAFT_177472 [Cytidiella melzeri]|nr:hypothetical protein BC835DRAFT_177472 [Cytidiella melzeri]
MTEYLDYPHSLQIDASFGAEYDPYPGNRVRQGPGRPSPSWISTGNLQPPQSSTPRVTPVNATSPIPTVHRLTRDFDGDPSRTPVALGSPLVMPGASRFREADQVEGTRWPAGPPTTVSYPGTRPSWMTGPGQAPPMRTHDGASLFQPVQASTPAPSRYGDPRSYVEAPPTRYGNPYQASRRYGATAENDTDSHRSSIERTYERQQEEQEYEEPPREVDEAEFEQDMISNSGSEGEGDMLEEEFIPVDAGVVDTHQGMPGMLQEPSEMHSMQTNKGKKRFVGGFMSSLRNFAGLGPKAPLPALVIPPTSKGAPARPPYGPQPVAGDLGVNRRPLAAPPPANSTPPPADHSLSTDRTLSSHGPVTPEQSELPITIPDLPEDSHLPNPYREHEPPIAAPERSQTPEEVYLQPTADYDAMSEPIEDDLPETTLSSHINRVGKFITDFVHLPWISPGNIAVPYKPTESRRARHTGPKPGVSWYTKENHEKLDLLATPTQPVQRRQPPTTARPRLQTTQSHRPAQRHPARRARTPLSGSTDTTSLGPATSPRRTRTPINAAGLTLSSSGLPSQALPYNYYYASPQALYIYPSSVASPQTRGRSGSDSQTAAPMPIPIPMPIQMQMQPGSSSSSSGVPAGAPQQQAVPIYMLAAPAPLVLPASPRQHHRRHSRRKQNAHHHHTGTAAYPMPVPVPVPVIQTTAAGDASRSPRAGKSTSPTGPAATTRKSPGAGASRSPIAARSPAAASTQPP